METVFKEQDTITEFTPNDVAMNDTEDTCFISVGGKVFNMTKYSKQLGEHLGVECGKDYPFRDQVFKKRTVNPNDFIVGKLKYPYISTYIIFIVIILLIGGIYNWRDTPLILFPLIVITYSLIYFLLWRMQQRYLQVVNKLPHLQNI